jgi:MoaA/NifB/PqqE/SkfB family radical SAM enzyme
LDYVENGSTRPVHLALHITNKCPHNCPQCNGGREADPTAELDIDTIYRVLNCAERNGAKAVTFGGGGDPLAHLDFVDAIKHAAECRLSIGVITNGVILPDEALKVMAEKCTWVRVSLDAGTEEQYKQTHGQSANLEKTLANIKRLADFPGRKATIGVSYLTSANCITDIPIAIDKVAKTGADYIIFRPYDGDTFDASEIIGEYRSGLQIAKHYERIQSPIRSYTKCHAMHFIIEVTPTGLVFPCCYWKNQNKLAYGNVNIDSLDEILHSRQFKKFAERDITKICPESCRNHPMNETIEVCFCRPVTHKEFL